MSSLRVVTNHKPRDVIQEYKLTAKERAEFDYLDWVAMERGEDSADFFRYKGQLYNLSDFERTRGPFFDVHPSLKSWDGYMSESYFSAIVIRYVPDSCCEQVVVGWVLL